MSSEPRSAARSLRERVESVQTLDLRSKRTRAELLVLLDTAEKFQAGRVPHLDRACELLWQAGHPAVAEALQREVEAVLHGE